MAYYDALVAKWATLAGTTAEKLAAIDALTLAGPNQDVRATAVVGYLALAGKLAGLQAYAASASTSAPAGVAAKQFFALLSIPSFTAFEMSDPTVYQAVEAWLNAWAADSATGITADNVAAILALAATTLPWWQAPVASGGGGLTSPVSQNDLDAVVGGLS